MSDNEPCDSRYDEDSQYSWEQLLEEGAAIFVDRPFVDHLEDVLQRLPKRVITKLVRSNTRILAHGPGFSGNTLQIGGLEDDGLLVYLSPKLLERPEEEILFTIAHEFAHVVNWREDSPSTNAAARAANEERELDELVESWGFKKPAGKDSYQRSVDASGA
jgi:hypothetical protein